MCRDAFLAAAQMALECRAIGLRHPKPRRGRRCTVGIVNVEPKIVTPCPACEILIRGRRRRVLAAMLREAHEASERSARENNVRVDWKDLLKTIRGRSIRRCSGCARTRCARRPARAAPAVGPLHDAQEMARTCRCDAFAVSSNGLSHCKEEDTPGPQLEATIRAYLRLVEKTVAHVARSA